MTQNGLALEDKFPNIITHNIGKYPMESGVFRDNDIKITLKKMLEDEYYNAIVNFQYQSKIEYIKKDKLYKMIGCKNVDCNKDKTIIFYDSLNGSFIVKYIKNNTLTTYKY